MRGAAGLCWLALLGSAPASADPPMENVLRAYAEVWNGGEVDRLDELLTADFQRHGGFGPASSRQQLRAVIERSRSFYRGLRLEVDDVVANAEKGAMRWRFSGAWGATRFELKSVNFSFYRFVDGRISEEWVLGNNMDLFRTFGYRLTPPRHRIVPPPVTEVPGPTLAERQREAAAELQRYAESARREGPKKAGELEIRTAVGCRLAIDGRALGWLPAGDRVILALDRGPHRIEAASLGGSVFWEHTVEIGPGSVMSLDVEAPRRVLRPHQGITEDLETGLMWQMRDNGENVTQRAAEAHCRDLVQGGFEDWRLPSIHELESLRVAESETSKRYRSIDGVLLTDCCPWTSTPHHDGDYFWTYVFSMDLRYLQYEALEYHMRVLCVRDAG